MVSKDNPPKNSVPQDILARVNVPQDNVSQDILPQKQCAPVDNVSQRQFARRKPAKEKICPRRQTAPDTIFKS